MTHSFKDTLIRPGIDGDKIDVITNGVDLSNFSPLAKDVVGLGTELGLNGSFVAGSLVRMVWLIALRRCWVLCRPCKKCWGDYPNMLKILRGVIAK